jgi:hypothetical protein
MERHRADKACAGCHARFDAFGLVFEGYGPVGERRDRDFGGRPGRHPGGVPDGSEASGLDGLVRYVRERRQGDFVDNLCRKLLAYGLGRSLLLSDEATVDEMKRRLAPAATASARWSRPSSRAPSSSPSAAPPPWPSNEHHVE